MLGDAGTDEENADARVAIVMQSLEEMAEHRRDAACCLMLSLWPVASELMLHDICGAIDLWIAHNLSATLVEHIRGLAAVETDPELKRYYEGLFEAKVLGDLLWWRPSSTPELLLDCPHLRQVVEDAAMIRWDTCKEDFRADGSLRDIYITPATVTDWRALYPLLRVYPGVEYSVDDVVQPPPDSIEEALAVRLSGSPMLRFRVGRALVVFHFFSEEEIECDFVPNEITSQADLDALLAFVRQLGDATRKRVMITPENSRELPFITYDPESGGFEHHEISS